MNLREELEGEENWPPELLDGVEGVNLAKRGSPSSALFWFRLVVEPERPLPLQFVLRPCLRHRQRSRCCRRRKPFGEYFGSHVSLYSLSLSVVCLVEKQEREGEWGFAVLIYKCLWALLWVWFDPKLVQLFGSEGGGHGIIGPRILAQKENYYKKD